MKAICFDIDGTLYPKSRLNRHLVSLSLPSPLLAYRYSRFRAEVRHQDATVTIPATQQGFRRRQASSILEAMGRQVDEHSVATMCSRIQRQFYDSWENPGLRLTPYPRVREAFMCVKRLGFSIGVLSDFPIGRKLELLGVADLVDCALCSEDSGYLKPHRAPFELLCNRLGLPQREVLYLGDSYTKDVVGAVHAGMQACLIVPSARSAGSRKRAERRFPLASAVFSDYHELILWLERLPKGGT